MASLVKKKKGHRLYYYLVESARVDGKPRIVHQAYLGTAEKLAELVQQKSAPVPLSATLRDFGLPGALWLAAKQSGVWPLLESLWPAPRSGPGPAHYLLLAAIHRICDPGPKTEVSNWYEKTILASVPCRALYLASLLGRLRTNSAGAARDRGSRRRSSRSCAVAFNRTVEGEAAGRSSAASLRYHQLLHLHCQHQHAQPVGAARPQQTRSAQLAPSGTELC